MTSRKKDVGRPKHINVSLVNAICSAVETEIAPMRVICDRFAIEYHTFRYWRNTGRKALVKSESDCSEYETLCRQLVSRLDELQKQHEKKLAENIKQPAHAETARLMLCLMPNWEFVESVSSG